MRILGIETSCDETAVAIIDVGGLAAQPRVRVLSNIVTSQVKLHAKFGGVVPHLAKREHQKNLVPVLEMALEKGGLLKSKVNLRPELPSVRLRVEDRSREGQRAKVQFKIQKLRTILEREPDLFMRMVPKVTILPALNINAIAVTVGPGLAPALWTGVNFARALSYLWAKPLIAVNHLEGHIYTNLLPEVDKAERLKTKNKSSSAVPSSFDLRPLAFPALCLIVSGGHTELVLMPAYGRYRVIGETQDDAAGEAFDKVAKMLGLGFPGGPVISRLAVTGNAAAFKFPRPMLQSNDFNFSFSGLKTAVLYTLCDLGKISAKTRRDVASSFEQAAVDVLVVKTVRAAREYRARTVLIGGGVAANKRLRTQLGIALQRQYASAQYLVPNPSLTGDNALMIALAGYFRRNKKTTWRNLQADANLRLDGQ